ncbi:MAG: carboxy terminal-processing peptidase [Burkholderiaceae bacterium]
MKNKILQVLLGFVFAANALALDAGITAPNQLQPLEQQAQAAHLSAEFLTRFHYKTVPLDAAMSEKIFDRYLKSIDPEKVYFVQADIDQFSDARKKLGDAIFNEDLAIPFAIFNLYEQRVTERFAYARDLLKQGFDFRQHEDYQYDREKASWPTSEADMQEVWRKRVKNDWLRLKLAGKDDKSIVQTLDKRYGKFPASVYKLKSDDVFQTFMNAYTMSIEPHTNYMGAREVQSFDIEMKLSLVGIGAVLQEKDEYTTIREIMPGGPAARSGKLKVGDRIVGVGQGKDGAITDVMGWRVDDTVDLIRGPADTIVALDILPAESVHEEKHKVVLLTRKKISLEQQAAKKSIIDVKEGKVTHRIGVITLPGFYEDFNARQKSDVNFKSATRDVARLLEELKKDKVESVLIDLRNNGGGSLSEAIELTGLFIGKGPVVQERDSAGKVTLESDDNADVAWSGPLGVLINRGSASASEIFAAAIQDYGRGVVIGAPSFGKGTVQAVVNLDEIAKNDKPKFGDLRITIAQFFRINGGTTQLRGVTPDISLPNFSDVENYGESSYDNALPWVQIKAADYSPVGDLKDVLPLLQKRHAERSAKDKNFQYLEEDIAELNAQRIKGVVSLNEAERRKERDAQQARIKSRERNTDLIALKAKNTKGKREKTKASSLQDDGLLDSERALADEIGTETELKGAKDILLTESVNILSDEVSLLKSNTRLAAKVLPGLAAVVHHRDE